jgi:hypothetical protein
MRTSAHNPTPGKIDSFSTSLAPINSPRALCFGFVARLCCVSLLTTIVALMRLFLAK